MSANASNNSTGNPSSCGNHRYFGLTYTVIMASVLLLLWIVGIVCNAAVFLVIVRTRRLRRSTTNALVANSSLIGFLFHVSIVPISVWVIINGGNWPLSFPCHLTGFLLIVLTLASWLCQAAIAVERYIKIMYPLKRIFTRCVSAVVIIAIWLSSCGVGLLPELTSEVVVSRARIICAPNFTDRTSAFMIVYSGLTLLSLVTMVLCQAAVYLVYKRIRRRSQLRTQASGTFVNSSAEEENGLELQPAMNGNGKEVNRESVVSQVSKSDSHGNDRGIERSDIGVTLSIFQGSIFYTVVYVGGMTALLVSHAYGPIDDTVCNVEGSARFYAASLQVLLSSMLLAVVPLICVRGNADLKGVICSFVRKLLCLHVTRSVDIQH